MSIALVLLASLDVQSAHALASAGGTGAAPPTGLIPNWKLQMTFDPASYTPQGHTHMMEQTQLQEARNSLHPLSSTPGQNSRRCGLVKLSDNIKLSTSSPAKGVWQSSTGVALASWHLNRFSKQMWETMYISDVDGHAAAKLQKQSANALFAEYGWKVNEANSFNSKVDRLIEPLNASQLNYSASQRPVVTLLALKDCMNALLFVVKLQKIERTPTLVEIYDRSGGLVAHARVNLIVARYQFLGPQGIVFATAEAPGLQQRMSWANLQNTVRVIPYQMMFEPNVDRNGSALLDQHYHYVFAAAVQAVSLHDKYGNAHMKSDIFSRMLEDTGIADDIVIWKWAFWLIFICSALFILCAFRYIHLQVYPLSEYTGGRDMQKRQSKGY